MAELRQALDGTLAGEKTIPGAVSWSAGTLSGATLVDAPDPASTLPLDAPPVTRPIRRTTLAGAASEIQRPPGSSVSPRPGRRVVPLLVAGLIGAAIVVIGALAALHRPASEPTAGGAGGPEPQRPASAAVAPVAPRAPAAPAPAVVEPEVPRAISVEIPAKPESAPPIRNQKVTPSSGSPSARPAPAPARRRPADKPRPVPAATTAPEPLKI
jgi:hypothetical protein